MVPREATTRAKWGANFPVVKDDTEEQVIIRLIMMSLFNTELNSPTTSSLCIRLSSLDQHRESSRDSSSSHGSSVLSGTAWFIGRFIALGYDDFVNDVTDAIACN